MARISYPYCLAAGLLAFAPAAAWASGSRQQAIYSFQAGADGYMPAASMIADANSNLYGTTQWGGGSANCSSGCGTVFELSPPASPGGTWMETVLYAFQGGADGAYPQFALAADKSGNLYGATSSGGDGTCTQGCGTVFELLRPTAPGGAWTEIVLYSFQGVPSGNGYGDLAGPSGVVLDGAGNIYGTAIGGGWCYTVSWGTYCYGGAFELKKPSKANPAWSYSIIYTLTGPTVGPTGPIWHAGSLYGTVGWGLYGFGEVFQLAPPTVAGAQWSWIPVYDFTGGPDGANPQAGLVFDKSGNLFGACAAGWPGWTPYGSVYELSPVAGGGWSQSSVYTFNPYEYSGGANGDLVMRGDDRLFGTTYGGGAGRYGEAFELTPPATTGGAWDYTALYTFRGRSNGSPTAGLTFGLGGALYGVTPAGGDLSCGNGSGCGTVYRVIP